MKGNLRHVRKGHVKQTSLVPGMSETSHMSGHSPNQQPGPGPPPTQARPSPARPVLRIALPLPRNSCRSKNRHLTSSSACSRTTDAARCSAWPRRATRSNIHHHSLHPPAPHPLRIFSIKQPDHPSIHPASHPPIHYPNTHHHAPAIMHPPSQGAHLHQHSELSLCFFRGKWRLTKRATATRDTCPQEEQCTRAPQEYKP